MTMPHHRAHWATRLLHTEANMIYCMAPIICNSPYHVKLGFTAYHHMWYGAPWYIVGLVLWIRLTMNNIILFSKCVWHVTGLVTYNNAILCMLGCDKAYNVLRQPYYVWNKHILYIYTYISMPYHLIYDMALIYPKRS